jgi:hypothetical protein
MGKWANGQMGKWANGQMGKWANGQMGKWGLNRPNLHMIMGIDIHLKTKYDITLTGAFISVENNSNTSRLIWQMHQ